VNNVISVKELAKLIEICKNKGVSKFKRNADGSFEFSIGVTENLPMTPSPQARGSAKKAEKIGKKKSIVMLVNDFKNQSEIDNKLIKISILPPPD
jgi:hypothetical protein